MLSRFYLLCFGEVVFSAVLWWVFLLLMVLALPQMVSFLEVIQEGCHYV
jgi:TM2 domain-containing membrane protein YozV